MQEAVTIDKFSKLNSNNLLVFRVGDSNCCILANVVESIIEIPRLTRLPLCTGTLKGIMDFQNTATPVHCLRTYFGETVSTDAKNGVVILARTAGTLTGLWVDEALDIIAVDDTHFHERDPILPDSLVTHIVNQNDRLLLYLDLERFHNQANSTTRHDKTSTYRQRTEPPNDHNIQSSQHTTSIDSTDASALQHTNPDTDNARNDTSDEPDNKTPTTRSINTSNNEPAKENNVPLNPVTSKIKGDQPNSAGIEHTDAVDSNDTQNDIAQLSPAVAINNDNTTGDTTEDVPETGRDTFESSVHDSNLADEPNTPASNKSKTTPFRTFCYIPDILLASSPKTLTITDNWCISKIKPKETEVDATTESELKPAISPKIGSGDRKIQSQTAIAEAANYEAESPGKYQSFHRIQQYASWLQSKSWWIPAALFSVLLLFVLLLVVLWLPTSGKDKPELATSQNKNDLTKTAQSTASGKPLKDKAAPNKTTAREQPAAAKTSSQKDRYRLILGLKTETYSITVERPQSKVAKAQQVKLQATEDVQEPAIADEPVSFAKTKPVPDTGPTLADTFPSRKFKQPVFDAHGDIHDWQTADYEEFIYIVIRGDTLWDIAAKFLGDPFQYKKLSELSHVRDPDWIYPGDLVRIRKIIRAQSPPR